MDTGQRIVATQVAQLLVCGRQTTHHFLERLHQFAHFVFSNHGKCGGKPAACHFLSNGHGLQQWGNDVEGDDLGNGRADNDCDSATKQQ